MSEHGKNAHWVRNINHNPRISFSSLNYEGEARVIDFMKESQLSAQVSAMMNAKYKWDQGLIVELEPLNG
jgi:hypothetical protein